MKKQKKVTIFLIVLLLMGQLITPELVQAAGNTTMEKVLEREEEAASYVEQDTVQENSEAADNEDPEAVRYSDNFRLDFYEEDADNNDEISTIGLGNSPFVNGLYNHAAKYDSYEILHGIDISKYQTVNWNRVKASGKVEFVFIRAGFRGYGSAGTLVKDPKFDSHMKGAASAGIPRGVYIFSQALTEAEARAEADFVISRLRAGNYKIDLPIVMDYEYASGPNGTTGRLYRARLSGSRATAVCKAFCDRIKAAGYSAMVYANKNMLEHMNASALSANNAIWLANYTTKTKYTGEYDFWQYSSKGRVNGISGNVDCNFWYRESKSPALSADSLTLQAGKSKTLEILNGTANTKYSWSSSNPAVAYVDNNGKVKAVSKGVTTVKVLSDKDKGFQKSCKVTVNEDMSDYKISDISTQIDNGKDVKPSVEVQSIKKMPSTAVANTMLKLRTGPSEEYEVGAKVAKEQKVTVCGQVSGWYAVSATIDGKTVRGYCDKSDLTVTSAVRILKKGTDYTVAYSNNKAGTGKVMVTGMGGGTYKGTIRKSFKIAAGIGGCTYSKISDKVYTGKTIKPAVTVKYGNKILKKGTDYTLSYGTNQSIGKGTVTVTGKGSYTGSKKLTFNIVPDKMESPKKSAVSTSSIKLSWKKDTTATGYQIYRASAYNGSYKLVKTLKASTTSWKDTGLVSGYGYYYKIRAYKTVSGTNYYGAYSSMANMKTKISGSTEATANKSQPLRKAPSDSSSKITTIASGASLKLAARTVDKSGKTWYYIKYKKGGKTYEGYVDSTLVVTKNIRGTGIVTSKGLNMRKGASASTNRVVSLYKNDKVKILGAKKGTNKVTWYKVSFTKGKKTYNGYVSSIYIKINY